MILEYPYVAIVTMQPHPETVALVEDIVVEYVTDMASLLLVKLFPPLLVYNRSKNFTRNAFFH